MVRAADVLLRANGGRSVLLRMPAPAIAGAQGEELGLATPEFQDAELAPVVFRKSRVSMQDGQLPKYELLISADAVAAQVTQFKLSSAQALFSMAIGVGVAGKLFLIEAVSTSESQGATYLYRLLLQEACGEWPM